MKPAVLLIDLQKDFLDVPTLEPAAGEVIERSALLLEECRSLSIPVIHVWTTADHESRMPHWKETGKMICLDGTDGHSPPESLLPLASETIIHKTFFSAFSNDTLPQLLRSLEADTLLIAGVHLHGCIRATVLDAYHQGYATIVAEDAIASDDPLHAAVTRRYLERRATSFLSVEEIRSRLAARMKSGGKSNQESIRTNVLELSHFSPRQNGHLLWKMPITTDEQIESAARSAKNSVAGWSSASAQDRLSFLERIAVLVESNSAQLSELIAMEVGKPVRQARDEVTRSAKLLRTLAAHRESLSEMSCGKDVSVRYRPLGAVALITPWNNPLAIPLGKIGPALFYGNAVVWKPAPAASAITLKIMELFRQAEVPHGLINLVIGDRSTALNLMNQPCIDAVSISGSLAAGYAAQDVCARRHIPLQGELGGNNAAVVWHDSNLEEAANKIAESAFGFAGQRCTANRRVVVESSCYTEFLRYLEQATSRLCWGDPLDEQTQVGPLVSQTKCKSLAALLTRTKQYAQFVRQPNHSADHLLSTGAYFPPTIIGCDEPNREIVQEESFGPILVVQRAETWRQAMALCNSVKQGLVAAIFSDSKEVQAAFLAEAEAGILKINTGTANAGAEAPFGGWKSSGMGPPEHGSANREFYTRTQTVYL